MKNYGITLIRGNYATSGRQKKKYYILIFFFSSVDIIEKPLKNDDINDDSGSQSSLLQVRDRLN